MVFFCLFYVLQKQRSIMKLCFPVIIGTVPLMESVHQVRKTIQVQPVMASPSRQEFFGASGSAESDPVQQEHHTQFRN